MQETMLARRSDYGRVFNSEQGKRVLHDLIKTHFVLRPTYSKGDIHLMQQREGERLVVLRILTILRMDPEQFAARLEEIENG